jgi:hypothetical protein
MTGMIFRILTGMLRHYDSPSKLNSIKIIHDQLHNFLSFQKSLFLSPS